MDGHDEPQTLQEAIEYFSNPDNCIAYLSRKRWPNGVECPTCGSKTVIYLANQRRWKCKGKHSKPQFSVKVGTVMEDSPIDLSKWLMAMWQIVNCKNGISSYEVHRAIGITQKSAWFLDHRIRFGLGLPMGNKFSGQVEADETFIGGKARNMHWDTSALLCLLNRDEEERRNICEDILQHASKEEIHIVTSTYTIVEVMRPKRNLPLTSD